MKKVKTKNKTKGLFGIFATLALTLGVGVSLRSNLGTKVQKVQAAATQVAHYDFAENVTNKSNTSSTGLNSGTLQTLLNKAVVSPAATVSALSGDVYDGKGSGGSGIPQAVLKVGKASGGGSFTFTIGGTQEVNQVVVVGYPWKDTSKLAINGGTTQTGTALTEKTYTFDVTETQSIVVDVTTSAVCISSLTLNYVGEGGGGDPEPEFGTLSSISIKTPASKLSYAYGETFSSAGLVLTASDDSDPVITKEVTSGFTTDYDGITFDASHLGSNEVTVSYAEEGDPKTVKYDITVVAEKPGFKQVEGTVLSVGATHTIATIEGTSHFAIGAYGTNIFGYTSITKDGNKFDDNDNILKFVVENGYALSTYAFKILNTVDAGKYITYTGSGNNLFATTKETVDASASWTIGTDGLITNSGTTNRIIKYNSSSPRFAAYTGGQVNAGVFVDESTIIPEPEFVATTRITLATDLAKKVFFTHETFSSAGVKVVAHDDVNEASKIVDTGFITDFDDKVFTSDDVEKGALVTVTYDTFTATYEIDINEARSFVKVTRQTQLQVGRIYIATGVHPDNGLVAMGKLEGTNRNVTSVVQIGNELFENDDVQILELHKGHDDVEGSFAFESVGGPKDGRFLAATGTGTSNTMQSEETITVKGSWVISVGESTSIEATNAGTERNKMRYNDFNNIFSAYGEGSQNAITLYVYDDPSITDPVYDEAKAFADWLLAVARDSELCGEKFLVAQSKWTELSAEAKALFLGDAEFQPAENRLLQWALANELSSLDDLDSSGIEVRNPNVKKNNTLLLTITILIGVIALTTVTGIYFIKKRQTQR